MSMFTTRKRILAAQIPGRYLYVGRAWEYAPRNGTCASKWNVGLGSADPCRKRAGRPRYSWNSPARSSAVMAPPARASPSITSAKSCDFRAFSAMTFSSMVSFATSR